MRSAHRALGLLEIVLPAIAVGLAFALAPGDDAGAGAGASTLTRESFYYVDQSDGRVTAEVRFEIVADGDRHRLAGVITAVGPTIEPAPGFEGVRGANRITAEEMLQLLRAGASLATAGGGESGSTHEIAGSLRAARYGTIPVRRLLADGSLDLHAQSRSEYLLEIALESPPLEDGDFCTELRVAGMPRMRIAHERRGASADVSGFESIGDPDERHARSAAGATAMASGTTAFRARGPQKDEQGAQDDGAYTEFDDKLAFAAWEHLDLEGKWVRYRKTCEADALWGSDFIFHLGERREFELLEWIAISDLALNDSREAAHLLARAGAPQWVRCNYWCVDEQETSGTSPRHAWATLVTENRALVLAWMEKYPATQIGRGAALYKALQEATTERGDVKEQLPPLDPAVVLALLEAPAELRDFGDAKRAEPGVTYLHQVERALSALVLGNFRDKLSLDKLDKLTRHPNERIRCSALLTYSRLESCHIPFRELKARADDAKQPLNVRRASFLAYSYHGHPEVGLNLHRTAQQLAQPLWSVAVSRVADLGDEFSSAMLGGLDVAPLDAPSRANFDKDLRRLEQYNAARSEYKQPRTARARLAQIAWAELNKDPLAGPLKEWFYPFVREHRERFVEDLKSIAGADADPAIDELAIGAEGVAIRGRMRELAKALLAEGPLAPKGTDK